MELFMTYLPHHVSEPDVIEALSSVLHKPPISISSFAAPVNFSVNVFSNRNKRNGKFSTSANVTIADAATAQRYLDIYGSPRPGLRVKGIQTRSFVSKREVDPIRLADVRANPFVSPATQKEREAELKQLKEPIKLSQIDFGRIVKKAGAPDTFSTEWTKALGGGGKLYLDGSTRTLVVETGTNSTKIIMPVSSISGLQSLSSQNSILVTLAQPPVYHKSKSEPFQSNSDSSFDLSDLISSVLGNDTGEKRISSIDPEHAKIAAFCSTSLLLTFPSKSQFDEFKHRRSDKLRLPKVRGSKITVAKLGRYSRIEELRKTLSKFRVPVAFQIELFLHSGLLDALQLIEILPTAQQLESDVGAVDTERILQQFGHRQTDSRSDTWSFDETAEQWYDEAAELQEAEYARPFDPSSARRFKNETSTPSETLKNQLLKLANRIKPLLESSLFARKSVFLCRHVILTPSRFILEGPFSDESNSIIRRYPKHASHFLRVSIRDEDLSTLSHSKEVDIANFLRQRFGPFFRSDGGLEIAGRQFDFLGYSQSALKEHSAWFVTPFVIDGKVLNAKSIRSSLGDFSSVITIPARYMARLAQAFTATQPSLLLDSDQIFHLEDIYSPSGSCFTDGVGTISPALAEQVEEILKASRTGSRRKGEKSSCYQFRLGGAKGMLVVDPLLKGKVVCLRKSQIKFEGNSLELDIADTFSRPLPCYLNRPLIKILEDLGIPIATFRSLQDDAVARVHKATTSLYDAAKLLDRTGLGGPAKLSSTIVNLASVLGLNAENLDPFLKNCEGLAVAEALRNIKFKARIPLPNCYTLVGVADEDGWLAEGQIYACIKKPSEPAIYLKGDICISRSPSIHPGDVQVVKAVGKLPDGVAPRLRTLVNCVVFSVRGNRSLPSCLGGGDLDGDIYQLITLPPELIPDRSKLATPADYAPPKMNRLARPATIDDGVDFFLGYITSDLMGSVATRHLQLSDYHLEGTRHPDCIALAQLHSDAVDYPKTGTPVDHRTLPKSPSQLKPQFMVGEWWSHQSRGEGKLYYTSEKALGQLFRAIPLKDINPRPNLKSDVLDASSTITNAVISTFARMDYPSPSDSLDQFDSSLVQEMTDHLYEFCDWLFHYAGINTLSSRPDRHLSEPEVFLSTLATPAKNPRLRQDKQARLQRQTTELFDWVRDEVVGYLDDNASEKEVVEVLERCWIGWLVAKKEKEEWFGVKSFGFIVLQVLLDLLKRLDERERA